MFLLERGMMNMKCSWRMVNTKWSVPVTRSSPQLGNDTMTTPTFWKPGSLYPGAPSSTSTADSQSGEHPTFIFNPNRHLSLAKQRKLLPIYSHRRELLYLLSKNRVLIVSGMTSSGKSTQIPQYLFESGYCAGEHWKICITQPRRISAVSLAERVAQEMNTSLGAELVGYQVQFDAKISSQTKIQYMTDGMLIREMMKDPLLSQYSVVMIDEAHERTLNTDLLLALLCKVLRKRNDLKLIIASATMDIKEMRDFFERATEKKDARATFNRSIGGASNKTPKAQSDSQQEGEISAILSIKGRQHAVDIYYTNQPVNNYLIAALNILQEIHRKSKPTGSDGVLIFLTGQEDIDKLMEYIEQENSDGSLVALPLHAALPFQEQRRIFDRVPRDKRKVVVSTNLAETALTIPGIAYVIDCGFAKQKYYNPMADKNCLVTDVISKASAIQRAGRAGREKHGKCFRLYTEADYEKFPTQTIPEIQRSDLLAFILQLKALGVENIVKFNLLSSPPSRLVMRALERLYALSAIDDYTNLTKPLGYKMAEFPVDPKIAKMLLESGRFGCSVEALSVAALLSVPSIFVGVRSVQDRVERAKERFAVAEGDPIALLNIYNKFVRRKNQSKWCHDNFINLKAMLRVSNLREQLSNYLKAFRIPLISCGDNIEGLMKCIVSGFFENAAQRLEEDGKSYVLISQNVPNSLPQEQRMLIHPQSFLFKFPPPHVIFFELVQTTETYMRHCMRVHPEWLAELVPHYYEFRQSQKYRSMVGGVENTR